jgi:hypothetical protein
MKPVWTWSLAVFAAFLLGDVARGGTAETTFSLEVGDLGGVTNERVTSEKVAGVNTATIAIGDGQQGVANLRVDLFLESRLASCLPPNPPCTGGENFFDSKNFAFGCADMVDNDSNGVSDSDDADCNGVQGWSISIHTGDCYAIKSTTVGLPANRGATTVGTVGDLNTNPPGLRDPSGSFEKTERIDPSLPINAGREGAVSAVVLAFTNPVLLDQVSKERILILNGVADTTGIPLDGMTAECALTILDPADEGLAGSGEPVKTAVTVAGETAIPDLCHLSYKVVVQSTPEDCGNGVDDNGDGLIDDDDPQCQEAGNCDDGIDNDGDGATDLEDLEDCPPGCEPPNDVVQETALSLSLVSPAGTAGLPIPRNCANKTVPWRAEVAPGATIPVKVAVNVVSRLAACSSPNPPCTGGENFFDSKNFVYGCADMVDNDSNGVSDADDADCNGVQGWSFSIDTGECFAIRSTTVGLPVNRGATTVGTVGDLNTNPPGLRDPSGSFEKTERIDPSHPLNGGNQGAVSAVVLAFTNPVILDQVSEETVCFLNGDMNISALVNPGDATAPCALTILDPAADGYAGSGEPVKTAITVAGETATPNLCQATVTLALPSGPEPVQSFVRGDPNDDARNDIADSVWVLNELLRSGPESPCQDAADINDDGLVDASDAVYNINYNFGIPSGPTPPAPFPACGVDPTADDLGCEHSDNCPDV